MVGKTDLESILYENSLVLILKWEDSHWTEDQKYIWYQNIFRHPSLIHQNQSEELINDPSQIILYLLVP